MRLFAFVVALGLFACRDDRSAPPSPSSTSSTPSTSAEPNGGYAPREDVDAVDQPGSHRVVARLHAGQHYPIQKRGGPGGRWCKLDLAEGAGWVECEGSRTGEPATGTFAYWVLSLSWSPAFCESPAGARSPDQCASGRPYAFVVHGLWPQNERGYPERCATTSAGPSPELVTRMLDLMPSRALVAHEWETHGTCSGMTADDYFTRVRATRASLVVPDAYVAPRQSFTSDAATLVAAFVAKNPRLTADAIAVRCKSELEEVLVCFDRDGAPRACGADVRTSCRSAFTVPPVR